MESQPGTSSHAPIPGAIRKNGKRLYESAREGAQAADLNIEPRLVSIFSCQLIENDGVEVQLPRFTLDVECGGGTYIRSLVRDIGDKLNTVATMTALARTKQGPFTRHDCLSKDQLSPDAIYDAISRHNEQLQA